MATTKKTATRKTAAKKPARAVKKTPAGKQATASKRTNTVRESISSATQEADDTFKQYSAIAGEQLVELRQLVRDAVDIYVGIPVLLGMRVADSATAPNVDLDALKSILEVVKARLTEAPSVDFDAVKAFVDEAKTVGHAQVATFESQIGAAAETVGKRLRSLYAA